MEERPAPAPRLEVVEGAVYPDWEAVYRDNVVAVYRLIHRQVGNRPDAEDLTEEVFLSALPRLHLPAALPAVRAYLAAAVRSAVAEHWRRRYAAPPTLSFVDDIGPAALDPEAVRDRAAAAEGRALRLLQLLPDRLRRVLELRFLEGNSVREAAQALGVSQGNARVLQHRALRRAAELADEMEPPR